MNDLISRKAAIDAFAELPYGYRGIVKGIIADVPSAQPEIIYCKDCKYKNRYKFPPKYEVKDYCENHEKVIDANGFCYLAERRENE